MRRWAILAVAITAFPLVLWLAFASLVWLGGDWENDSYAVGWTFNMAMVATLYIVAIVVPIGIIATMVRFFHERRVQKRGWR